jgi:hypothetical protein
MKMLWNPNFNVHRVLPEHSHPLHLCVVCDCFCDMMADLSIVMCHAVTGTPEKLIARRYGIVSMSWQVLSTLDGDLVHS